MFFQRKKVLYREEEYLPYYISAPTKIRKMHTSRTDADPTREYKIRALTYIATVLSENASVRDYVITFQANITYIPDDFIVKVDFYHSERPYLYFVQVNYRLRKIDFTETFSLEEYATEFRAIASNQNARSRHCFGEDLHIHFWYFSNRRVTIDDYDFAPDNETYASILTESANKKCFKVTPSAEDNQNQYQDFLNNFFFFLDQGDYTKILSDLEEMLNISSYLVIDLVNYIDVYLHDPKGLSNRLTKRHFDTEALKLRLCNVSLAPYTKIFPMNPELVQIWNKLTLNYDITLVDNVKDIKRCLLGCAREKVRRDLDLPDFEWANSSLDENFKTKFKRLLVKRNSVGTTRIKHYWIIPDNLSILLEELWRLDMLPLILQGDSCLPILKRYSYLRKKFIIIGNLSEECEANLQSDGCRLFKNLSNLLNIDNDHLVSLTGGIRVSLQGRKPTSLRSITNNDQDVMVRITCSKLLQLMKNTKAYMKRECLENVASTIFIVEDKLSHETWNFLSVDGCKLPNIKITCKHVEAFAEEWETHLRFDNYSLCYLRLVDGKLEFIQGDIFKFRHFFVDQDDQNIYLDENNEAIPVIGKILGLNEYLPKQYYIKRFLSRAMLNLSYLQRQEKLITFFCGNLESLDYSIKQQIIAVNILDAMKANSTDISSIFVNINRNTIDNYWSDPYFENYQKLYIKITNGSMEILKHDKCENLSEYITYSEPVSEDVLFTEINNKFTIISGEAGIGKSALLHSLSERYSSEDYILFYDLLHFVKHLQEDTSILLEDPLEFIFKKTEKCMFQNLLDSIFTFHKKTQRLVLFLDSFDEVLRICQDEVLEFLEKIRKSDVKLVVSSTLVNEALLVDKFGTQSIRIDIIKKNAIKETIKGTLDYIPSELLQNPLHLNFLNFARTDKFSMYEHVIENQIRWYCHRYRLPYSKLSKYSRNFVLEDCKLLALVAVFGKEAIINSGITTNYEFLIDRFKLQGVGLGVINNFENDKPVFMREEFAYYLAMEWLKENIEDKFNARTIYKMLVKDDYTKIKYFFDNQICTGLTLHKAILNGDVEKVSALCQEKETILMEPDKCGRTALHLACSYLSNGNRGSYCIIETIVKTIVARGCTYNIKDNMEWTWIQYLNSKHSGDFVYNCCHYGLTNTLELYLNNENNVKLEESNLLDLLTNSHFDTILMLFKRDSSLVDRYFFPSLEKTLTVGRLDVFRSLIELKCPWGIRKQEQYNILLEISAALNEKLDINIAPFHIASSCGNVEIMNELLLQGVDVNVRDNFLRTPLHYSVVDGSCDVVFLLMQNLADLQAKDQNNDAPLHLALRFLKNNIVDLLLTKGASGYVQNKHDKSPLHIATDKNLYGISEALVQNGINIHFMDDDGNSALHIAVRNGFDTITKLLLDHGADIEQRNFQNNTILHLACEGNHLEVIKVIFDNIKPMKATNLLSFKNNDGETPMHVACKKGRLEIVMLLLEYGASVLETDNFVNTPMHLLIEWNWVDSFQEVLLKIPLKENNYVELKKSLIHSAIEKGHISLLKCLLQKHIDVTCNDK